MKKTVDVVAALIYRIKDGEREFMICQRGAHKPRPLAWEFVGGKVESGESFENALIRECREELDILVRPGELFMETLHEYPDVIVHLHLFYTEIAQGEPKLLEHNDLRWITPPMISQFEFCPADDVILARILMQYAQEKIPVGRWKHFKGGEYEVLGIARDSESLAPTVVYRALYGEGGLWTRPAMMWLESVERDGVIMPRFAYLGEDV